MCLQLPDWYYNIELDKIGIGSFAVDDCLNDY